MQCGATTKKGQPCGLRIEVRDTPDGPRCRSHDPARRVELIATAQAGAQRAARERQTQVTPDDWPLSHGGPPRDPDECATLAAWAAQHVTLGKIDPKIAREIGTLCNAAMKAWKEGAIHRRVEAYAALVESLKPKGTSK